MTDMFSGLHHVQLAIPEGSEEQARKFYGGVLGMVELDKPAVLAARGGCWFRSGGWEIHLGVEVPFAPAAKAHPGVLVNTLDLLEQRLRSAGVKVEWDDNFPATDASTAVTPTATGWSSWSHTSSNRHRSPRLQAVLLLGLAFPSTSKTALTTRRWAP